MFFCRFVSGGSASTEFYCKNEKRVQKICKIDWFFDVSKQAIAQVPIFFMFKNQFLGASPDPPDPADPGNPPEMEQELRLATHQQRAGGQDDGSLNKLPQIMCLPICGPGFDPWSILNQKI